MLVFQPCIVHAQFASKVAQNTLKHFPKVRFPWVVITTLYHLMLHYHGIKNLLYHW